MSRKPHQIAQNDVRYSALPEHGNIADHGVGTGRPRSIRQARVGRRSAGSLEAALPADALAVGLYRTRGEGVGPNDVRVLSNGCSFFITEAEYRRRECQPLFEELPWHGISIEKTTGGKR